MAPQTGEGRPGEMRGIFGGLHDSAQEFCYVACTPNLRNAQSGGPSFRGEPHLEARELFQREPVS
jgi:hypothetical protein